LLGLEARFDEAEALPTETRLAAQAELRALLEAATLEVLPSVEGGLAAALERLRPGLEGLGAERGASLDAFLAAAPRLAAAPSIVRLAMEAGVAPGEAASVWDEVERIYQFDQLRQAARTAPLAGPFAGRARATLLDELRAAQSRLAGARLAGRQVDDAAGRALAGEAARLADFAGVSVAARTLSTLAA
jgi:glutamate dehydrogenase